jgi:hypothetical protein
MDVKFVVIVEDIKDFSIDVKEIEKLKMEMIERITSQMLQNQLYLANVC